MTQQFDIESIIQDRGIAQSKYKIEINVWFEFISFSLLRKFYTQTSFKKLILFKDGNALQSLQSMYISFHYMSF